MVNAETGKMNGAIDIAKLLMAVLVIGIHTEPFGFNFWLDKGFGIITRLCVPFFFVTSAYFFWNKEKPASTFLKRVVLLYVIWSIIYLPFDIRAFKGMTLLQLLNRFLWTGNEHALWFVCGLIVGFLITYGLLKFLKPKYVLVIAIIILVIGTLKSTYASALQQLFGFSLPDFLGSRNGLFYGFPYMAMGMAIAKTKTQGKTENKKKLYIGFIVSLLLLMIESYLFVICFQTDSTILWLMVFPYTYFFFEIVNNTDIQIKKKVSYTCRKMSTLLYVSQFLFIPVFSRFLSHILLFLVVVLVTAVFSLVIIKLSEMRYLRFLRYLY